MRALIVPLALLSLSGCTIVAEAECPSLDDCDLDCADFKQDRDGCSVCECTTPEEVVVCWETSECPDGQVCDAVNYCEASPDCAEGADCPAVCYGRCVDPAATCRSDDDCPDGEVCSPFGNAVSPDEKPE